MTNGSVPRPGLTLAAVAVVQFMVSLDLSVVNVTTCLPPGTEPVRVGPRPGARRARAGPYPQWPLGQLVAPTRSTTTVDTEV